MNPKKRLLIADDHGLMRGFIAYDGTIALQRTYGEDFVNHKRVTITRFPLCPSLLEVL